MLLTILTFGNAKKLIATDTSASPLKAESNMDAKHTVLNITAFKDTAL